MEERYSRTVREGDAYVSIRQIANNQLIFNVGSLFQLTVDEETLHDTELIIRPSTMDLLVKVYAQWREQSGGRSGETPQELPEQAD
jgi:hypothetical protein